MPLSLTPLNGVGGGDGGGVVVVVAVDDDGPGDPDRAHRVPLLETGFQQGKNKDVPQNIWEIGIILLGNERAVLFFHCESAEKKGKFVELLPLLSLARGRAKGGGEREQEEKRK